MMVTFFEYFYSVFTIFLLVIFLKKSQTKHSLKDKIKLWCLFGFLYNLFSLSVIYTALPLVWFNPYIEFFGVMIVHIIISLISSLAYILIGYTDWKTKNQKLYSLFFSLSFVGTEIIRVIILMLVFWGSGSVSGLNFTLGSLGMVLANTPLVELAYPYGIFSLTFFTVLIVSLFVLEKNNHYRFLGFTFIILIFLFIHFSDHSNQISKPITVGVVSTNYPETSFDEKTVGQIFSQRREGLKKIIYDLSKNNLDIILLPEDTRFLSLKDTQEVRDLMQKFPNTYFFDGNTLKDGNNFFNASTVYQLKEKVYLWRGKNFLLPFDEYIPKLFRPLFLLIDRETFLDFEKNHTYTKNESHVSFILPTGKFGTLICSELFSFSSVSSLISQKPNIIFGQSQLSIFHKRDWFTAYYLMTQKINGAATKIPLIITANYMPTTVVNGYGKITDLEEAKNGVNIFYVDKYLVQKIK